eukprot:CAMPEP_0170617988 /NCGR_PEP_ID=MMETSP0224-20130122/26718_1 /TAXON_ID=285029 /ORGANISM="Togula jolla, Strain CCCM 725" /LENGTH=279 /DNA_ID=CAMNT_0010943931 /DNA_START=138 /DNA_END=974 /DNA_ORIENTATION=+
MATAMQSDAVESQSAKVQAAPLPGAGHTSEALEGEFLVSWVRTRKYWRVGRFEDPAADLELDIGFRLDKRNETNCVELLLMAGEKTAGYVLLETGSGSLALRGMYIREDLRGKGLSSSLIAIWLSVCLESGLHPSTKRMDKPLISLVLQKLGFVPSSTQTQLEVSSEEHSGKVLIWSLNMDQLCSTLTRRHLKGQGLEIAQTRPAQSTTVCINTTYELPSIEVAKERLSSVLAEKRLSLFARERPAGKEAFGVFFAREIVHLPDFHTLRESRRTKTTTS